jgi:peptidoglycan/LPS O-acetylase OafA/YrhL
VTQSGPPTNGGSGHLHAVDAVRVLTVAGVISIHVVVFTTAPTSGLGSGLASLLHVNRELFLLLSAFVLTYAYNKRDIFSLPTFWRKRYWLVAVPYVTWTAIYSAINGPPLSQLSSWLAQFAANLATGAACYHLYFLLLSMQLYLVFPLLLRLARATRRHHLLLLAVSFLAQVALSALFHYRLQGGGVLSAWQHNPDAVLLSFQFYVVAGAVAALHLPELTAWVTSHRKVVATLVCGAAGVGIASFLADMWLAGMPTFQASEVFQPVIAIEAPIYALGLYCFGQWLGEHRNRVVDRILSFGSDASFGIYLAHPLVIQGVLLLGAATGALSAFIHLKDPLIIGLDLAVGVPAVYTVCALAVAVCRRSALSLPLTGRTAVPYSWAHTVAALVRRPVAKAASDTNAA